MATAAKLVQNEELDLQKRSSTSRHFEEELRQRVGTSPTPKLEVDGMSIILSGTSPIVENSPAVVELNA
jgi:hypothetical protein